MTHSLAGKKIAIIATNGFEESELVEPRNYLDKAGAQTHCRYLPRTAIAD